MTAEKHTCGIYRATMDGKQYPHENRVPMTNLDNTYDVHFGLNTPKNNQQFSQLGCIPCTANTNGESKNNMLSV